MTRLIKDLNKFYICQCGNWQTVVQAETEEKAATLAMEKIMFDEDARKITLCGSLYVQELNSNLLERFEDSDIMLFESVMILANAGFHAESLKLQMHLKNESR